jgi:tRNA-binding EMAP/Myf-like protein
MIDHLKLTKEVIENFNGVSELPDFEHYAAQLDLVLSRWRDEERAKLQTLTVNAGYAKYNVVAGNVTVIPKADAVVIYNE